MDSDELIIVIQETGRMPEESFDIYQASTGPEYFMTQSTLNLFYKSTLEVINKRYPDFLPYQIKYDYGQLRTYDPIEEQKAYQQQLIRFEKCLKHFSRLKRYRDIMKLGEKNPDYRFIYGNLPGDSDDIISYIQGMSPEEIYKRRIHTEAVLQNIRKVYFA